MCGHFTQFRQHTTHMLISINEGDDNRKVATGLNEMSCTYFVSAKEPSNGMEHHRSSDVLFAQVPENFQVQGTVMPGIAFGEIHRYLYGHMVRHSTTTVRARHLPALRQGKAGCWR